MMQAIQEETTAPQETEPKLYVRTIADVLCRHLEAMNTSVHWAQPDGGEVSWEPPKLVWPKHPNIGYLVEEGKNEGTIVRVVHINQTRGQQRQIEPLIVVKFLREMNAAFQESILISKFIAQMDLQKMLQTQADPKQRYLM